MGLEPTQAAIVGHLPDQLVFTGFRITPVVARLSADFKAAGARTVGGRSVRARVDSGTPDRWPPSETQER